MSTVVDDEKEFDDAKYALLVAEVPLRHQISPLNAVAMLMLTP